MASREQLISLCVRIAASAALTYVTIRYAMRFLDPNYETKEQIKNRAKQLLVSLGMSPSISLTEHELRIATQFVTYNEGADWSDLGGCDEVINQLKDRIILPLKIRCEHESLVLSSDLLSPPKGILLYGPPGCGKTLLAKAIARAAKARFINLRVSILTDKWYGESQKLAAAVFSLAEKFQPTIIFIDEIDSFLRDRQAQDHEATAMMKAEFMSLWDGFASSKNVVIVLGATNRPFDVDKAILRRMPARFYVPLPSASARADILRVILRDEPVDSNIDFEKVAEAAGNLSGSDLKEVCRLAVLRRLKMAVENGENLYNEVHRAVQESDLIESVRKYTETAIVTNNNLFFTEPLD
uniref:AAA domain-containing protein n=1 Tax=Syphacia muris TaxID=451379 RepID=A0A0N5A8Q8_9BILA